MNNKFFSNILSYFYLFFIKREKNYRKKISMIFEVLKSDCSSKFKSKAVSFYFKTLKENFDNADIIYYLDLLLEEINFKVSSNDTFIIIQSVNFFKNTYFEKELFLILDIFLKLEISFDFFTSKTFIDSYLMSVIKKVNDYELFFNKLNLLKFDFKLFANHSLDLSNVRVFEKYYPNELIEVCNYHNSSILFEKADTKASILLELFYAKTNEKTLSWIDFFIELYKLEKIQLYSIEYISLLKLNSKHKVSKIKEILLNKVSEDSVLYTLIKEDYLFNKINLLCEKELSILSNTKNIKEIVFSFLKKDSKILVKNFMTKVFKNKEVDFNLLKACVLFDEDPVDIIQTNILLIPETFSSNDFSDTDISLIKTITSQLTRQKRTEFILEIYKTPLFLKKIKTSYFAIIEKDPEFKIDFKFKNISNFIDKLENIHRVKYFNNQNLSLIKDFPFLKKIDGSIIDDLRIEIPKTSYDLFFYGQRMNNCIFTYVNKCLTKSSIILAVYRNNKIEYNIELGINTFSTETLDNLVSNNKSRLEIIQFQKKLNETAPKSDYHKIQDFLRKNNIIA